MSNYMLSITKVCFLVHLLLEGLQRSGGVFFLDIREWLGCSRQLAAIPFALNRVVSVIVELFFRFQSNGGSPGPLIGWGCFLSAVGVGVCFLAIDIVWHAVFWGIIFGSGIGIAIPMLLPHLSQIKENSAKSSLKSAGPSFGCMVLPFLVSKLIDHYGLNGCYVILSGIILNCLPFVLISFYKIRFEWLKTEWRLRRRSKRYEISKKDEKSNDVSVYKPRNIREFYNQSFMENLEPDTLERVSVKEGSQSLPCMETIDILQPIIEAKLKMVNQINNREAFGLDKKYMPIANSEQKEINSVNLPEQVESENVVTKSEKRIDDNEVKASISEDHAENKNQDNKQEVKESVSEDHCLKDDAKTNEKETLEESEATNKDKQDPPAVITTINQTFQVKKEFSKHTNQPSKELRTSFPLEIKVHVVECTITTTEDISFSDRSKLTVNRNGYRRHSNSLITASYENIDFTQLFQNNTSSPLHKQQWNYASRMCLITEEGEEDSDNPNSIFVSQEVETQTTTDSSSKQRNFRRTCLELARPSYLAIIYASVIYEFSLAVLLIIYSDFAKDIGDATVTSNMVLIAFGLGGIIGQLSFNHWGNNLLVDGSHAAAAVIFILNGLAIAGILWSMNVAWLSGFYALLGFVENGVIMILPKLISDHTDEKERASLYMICKCLSVLAFICIPCSVGLSRDVTGNYDLLLQVISCMSVLCAVLCYFLPKWNGAQHIREESTGRHQIQV
ncbi:uncharacterized protein LOC129963890 [Argiope bruennichi]|uniref:uncharacterized protein LOC129963890 n=1 Tax=Argiope bruennichi TaxID=94029 RepID=UPI002494AAF0|nr:uncharacterized protein LOC129963890 [Argiope bruennichi]